MGLLKQYVVDLLHIYRLGKKVYRDNYFKHTAQLSSLEHTKSPRRTHIINYLVSLIDAQHYLEIGVRDPKKNFDRIVCNNKFSVDPGVEFKDNPVDFKMTSDDFFEQLRNEQLKIASDIKFDVIFIDGLHLSHQVERDILNSLEFLTSDGFIILHDCNPPSEYHQREAYDFVMSPAGPFWNGTTWKAFYKYRHREGLYSICFDSDWGVGVISKKQYPSFNHIEGNMQNEFYEFSILDAHRRAHLNLCSFEQWETSIKK
jgi:hypothetical protein